jgi:hypothetical protein
MTVSLHKLPRYLTDEVLIKEAASTVFPGHRRIAEATLAMPPAEREVRVRAAQLFANTTPGWRASDAHFYAARQPLSWCESLINRERERKLAERALRAAGVNGVVYWDGSVGITNPDSLLIDRVVR